MNKPTFCRTVLASASSIIFTFFNSCYMFIFLLFHEIWFCCENFLTEFKIAFIRIFLPHSGSILDFQLCWKSGKFQPARWSHEVAILCSWDHPATTSVENQNLKLFLSMFCDVPTLIVPPINKVCVVPPFSICCFLTPIVSPLKKVGAVSPLPVYVFLCTRAPPPPM